MLLITKKAATNL